MVLNKHVLLEGSLLKFNASIITLFLEKPASSLSYLLFSLVSETILNKFTKYYNTCFVLQGVFQRISIFIQCTCGTIQYGICH